jgi:putative tributyrin esterase
MTPRASKGGLRRVFAVRGRPPLNGGRDMALIQCEFFSEMLGLSTSMTVILPQATTQQIGLVGTAAAGKHPTLYLLHGMSDDHTTWVRRTSVERYVAPLGLAVVMPAAHRSFYTDMAQGYRYWTFVSQELPALARAFFPLSEGREENFVAGLSMGGYGAFKLAFSYPERYAAAASLSGVLDIVTTLRTLRDPDLLAERRRIFGDLDTIAGGTHDLFYLARQLAGSATAKPRLYQCCGTGDALYESNVRAKGYFQSLGLDVTYEEGSGEHEWGYWDQQIQRVLAWLPLQRG